MKWVRLIMLGVLLLPAEAFAADARIRSQPYNANAIVQIAGRQGYETAIAFGADERIENIAVGDSSTWQVNPNKRANVLFIKPVEAQAQTNMTIVTDKRVYLFDLVPAAANDTALYVLRFTYATPSMPVGKKLKSVEEAAANPPELDNDYAWTPPEKLNFAWTVSGDKHILPARCYDDGRSIYLKFAPDQPMPAILIAGERGAEGPANYAVRNDTVVIGALVSQIVLRSGRKSATLTRGVSPESPHAVPASDNSYRVGAN